MEIKLTPEQIEQAKNSAIDAIKEDYRQSGSWWRIALTAAAPFLQLPWEPPSTKEADHLVCFLTRSVQNGVRFESVSTAQTFELLKIFVAERNASLLPKPVDPRREKLGIAGYEPKEIIAILAALDSEVKP